MEPPVLLITGASRGLGAAAARSAAKLGARLVLAARSIDALEQLAQEIRADGGRALAVPVDLTRPEDGEVLIQRALDEFGRVDGLINNAGQAEPIAPVGEANLAEWQRSWQVNLLGPVWLTRLALPALRQSSGRVINITSGAAGAIIAGWGAYSASKAALDHVTKVLATEEPGITVVALRPGIVDTEMQAVIRQKGAGNMAEKNYRFLANLHEQGRLLPPEQPGRAMALLALRAPHAWSGEILNWDDPKVSALAGQED